MNEKEDKIIDKIFPLALRIAYIKSELAKQIANRVIIEVEKNRKLSPQEKDAVNRAVDEIVAQQPPETFGIDPNWVPKDEEEVRQRLIQLRYDNKFKEKIVKNVVEKLQGNQSRLAS